MIVAIVCMCVLVYRFELSRNRLTQCFLPNIFQKKEERSAYTTFSQCQWHVLSKNEKWQK